MAGLVPATPVFALPGIQAVDARDIRREDALRAFARARRFPSNLILLQKKKRPVETGRRRIL
jgi:hypothetical protein